MSSINRSVFNRHLFYRIKLQTPKTKGTKIGVLKNFAIFTGKHLCWSLFLIKFQAFRAKGLKASFRTPLVAAYASYFVPSVQHVFQTMNYTLSFFYKQRFFSTQLHCCLTFSWIELQMLLTCCLIHISIITTRHFLCLLHLCPCLDVGLFMSYLRELFFILIFNFTDFFFCLFFEICLIIFGW